MGKRGLYLVGQWVLNGQVDLSFLRLHLIAEKVGQGRGSLEMDEVQGALWQMQSRQATPLLSWDSQPDAGDGDRWRLLLQLSLDGLEFHRQKRLS